MSAAVKLASPIRKILVQTTANQSQIGFQNLRIIIYRNIGRNTLRTSRSPPTSSERPPNLTPLTILRIDCKSIFEIGLKNCFEESAKVRFANFENLFAKYWRSGLNENLLRRAIDSSRTSALDSRLAL